MDGDAPQVPVTQEVKPEVKKVPQVPQQPSVDSQTPLESTPPPKPKKRETKKVVILLILLPVFAIVAYGVFIAITYWNCSKITPQACEVGECGFSLTGFNLVSVMKDNCCGNALCEESYETNADCPTDCPNCDDDSRLTVDSFNYETQKCDNIATHYFLEDFEEGITSISKKENWKIADDQGDKVLDCPGKKINGVEHDWANFGNEGWANYESELSFKLVENLEGFGFHFFSKGEQGYIVDIRDRKITLKKGGQQSREEIILEPFDFKLDEWYVLKTEKTGSNIKIYIDDTIVLEYTDNQPLDTGLLRIETFGDGHVRLDDISIQI
ncbi:hypothetical protein DRH13_05785 [Candidatus Woesebacteria bacterium]|nr:MAG: hypothetical protein DRH13_05785 [Candidatus Woesebacteria bacterium]